MTRVLMSYPGLIPSVLLCGQLQLTWLAEHRDNISFCSVARDDLTPELCGWADVVFLVRADSALELDLVKQWKEAGKKLIYVLDDDLFHVPEQCSSAAFYGKKHVQDIIMSIMYECDYLLSPSKRLRAMYGEMFIRTFGIEEPSAQNICKSVNTSGPVKIGFAGSVDRGGDVDLLLTDAIEELLNRYGNKISIEFFGAAPQLAERFKLKCYPYSDSYEDYQYTMQNLNWDIALAPMPDTPFHACKHYNKFVEYAGCGIAGVYSNVLPYREVVRNGQNGLLCDNTTQAWVDAVSLLIEDPKLRQNISACCVRQAQDQFSIASTAQALELELGNVWQHVADRHDPIKIRMAIHGKSIVKRIIRGVKKYGVRAPAIAIQKMIGKWLCF